MSVFFFLGYVGDGRICIADRRRPCDIVNNCSPYGLCQLNQETNDYECHCLNGYTGNGYICERSHESENELEETETEKPKDKVSEKCVMGICWCPDGYVNDPGTRFCLKKDELEETTPAENSQENEDRK